MPVWLRDAEVDQTCHRQSHVKPVAEAEVVDELKDVLHAEKDEAHQTLQNGTCYYCAVRLAILAYLLLFLKYSHVKEQCRDGSEALRVYQTQAVWEVALSGANEK